VADIPIIPVSTELVWKLCVEMGISVSEYRRLVRIDRFDQIYRSYERRFTHPYIASQLHQVKSFMGIQSKVSHTTNPRQFHPEKILVKHKALLRVQVATRFVVNPKPTGNDGGRHFEGWISPYYMHPSYVNLLGANRSVSREYTSLRKMLNSAILVGLIDEDIAIYEDQFGVPIMRDVLNMTAFYSPIKKKLVIGFPVIEKTTKGYYLYQKYEFDHLTYTIKEVSDVASHFMSKLELSYAWNSISTYESFDGYNCDGFKSLNDRTMIQLALHPISVTNDNLSNLGPFIIRRFPCPQIGQTMMASMAVVIRVNQDMMLHSSLGFRLRFGQLSNHKSNLLYGRFETGNLTAEVDVDEFYYRHGDKIRKGGRKPKFRSIRREIEFRRQIDTSTL